MPPSASLRNSLHSGRPVRLNPPSPYAGTLSLWISLFLVALAAAALLFFVLNQEYQARLAQQARNQASGVFELENVSLVIMLDEPATVYSNTGDYLYKPGTVQGTFRGVIWKIEGQAGDEIQLYAVGDNLGALVYHFDPKTYTAKMKWVWLVGGDSNNKPFEARILELHNS